MWSYGSTKRTDFTLCLWQTSVSLRVTEHYVSTLLLKSSGLDPCLWLLWRSYSIASSFLIINDNLKMYVYNFSLCCINNSSPIFFQVYIQNIFLLGMEVRSYLSFERIWIGTVDLCVYGCIGASLYHSGDERYCQSVCWKLVQSWLKIVLFSCLHLMFIGFQILLQLWIEM